MKKCSGFFTYECYSGDCPIALHNDHPDMYPETITCEECSYYRGCAVCNTPELYQKSTNSCRIDHKEECP